METKTPRMVELVCRRFESLATTVSNKRTLDRNCIAIAYRNYPNFSEKTIEGIDTQRRFGYYPDPKEQFL